MIDLTKQELFTVIESLESCVPDCEVRAFGSRTNITATANSDLDLALIHDGPVPEYKLNLLRQTFRKSGLAFEVDLFDWARINDHFREEIDREYVLIQISSSVFPH